MDRKLRGLDREGYSAAWIMNHVRQGMFRSLSDEDFEAVKEAWDQEETRRRRIKHRVEMKAFFDETALELHALGHDLLDIDEQIQGTTEGGRSFSRSLLIYRPYRGRKAHALTVKRLGDEFVLRKLCESWGRELTIGHRDHLMLGRKHIRCESCDALSWNESSSVITWNWVYAARKDRLTQIDQMVI